MSPLLRFLENELQIGCLIFMGSVYVLRTAWLLHFRMPRERTRAEGNETAAVILSLTSVARPGAMESTRQKPWFYVQFMIFHFAVTAAIAATFIIPYRPALFDVKPLAAAFQAVLAAGVVVGLLRLSRRLRVPAVRIISSPDDYFSLVLMILYFAAGFLAVPQDYERAEWPLILFFGLTAFFLVYVPFSKISHYLYYPFARIVLGKTLGHRGILPSGKKGLRIELEKS
jgi:hypothetical protein